MRSFELGPHCVNRHQLRVRFGETDLMGIVHHAAYLSYAEVGRVQYLRRRGICYGDWVARGLHLPVIEVALKYRRPARFDDLLCVETQLEELGRVKLRFCYRILRHEPESGAEALLCWASTTLACVGIEHAPRRLPLDLIEALRSPEPPAAQGAAP